MYMFLIVILTRFVSHDRLLSVGDVEGFPALKP